jgi:transposase
MIPEAREVRLKPKIRKVLEARCRAPSTSHRDVKRAKIVLLAAEGRSTRSIAEEVGVQPRIVSNWRRRFADHGPGGLKERPRASKKPIYGKETNKRILALLEKPPPQGYGRWTGPILAKALGDVDVQYVWRFLREHKIDLAARKSWCESNDPSLRRKPPMSWACTSIRPPRRSFSVSMRSPRSSVSSTISRVASLTSSSFAEAVESRPSINAVSSSRVRCEAGSLVAMGCSFAGLCQARVVNHSHSCKGCTPPNSQQV